MRLFLILAGVLGLPPFSMSIYGQTPASPPPAGTTTAEAAPSGTSTDLFVMFGSDFDRPGLLPRSNYNIGIGHTFGFLKKGPLGDELTFGYTYENSGTHGFLHTVWRSGSQAFATQTAVRSWTRALISSVTKQAIKASF